MKHSPRMIVCVLFCILSGSLVLTGCSGDEQASGRGDPNGQEPAATRNEHVATNRVQARFVSAADDGEDAPTGNWGTLSGRFVYDGEAPDPAPITPTKDVDYCGQFDLVDESLVVNDQGQIANVFVYIYVPRGSSLEVHESYADSDEQVVLDNSECRFEPHCATIRLSQTLVVKNSDPKGHNTNLANRNEPFNLTVPIDGAIEQTFKVSQNYPMPARCNIHPWMSAHLLIREDPYMDVSGPDGKFEIRNIPAGSHEFVFWHERPGTLRNVKAGGATTDRRGRLKLDIPAGKIVDLGEIKVPAALLKEQ